MEAKTRVRDTRAGANAPPRAIRIPVSGAADPDRVLTLRFDRFVEEVLGAPEPHDLGELDRLGAGADFLLDLTGGGMDFGAAPGEPGDLADYVLALTDDALEEAHRILGYEAYEPPGHDHPDPHGRWLGTLLRLTDHLGDEATFRAICDALIRAEPVEDPSVAPGWGIL